MLDNYIGGDWQPPESGAYLRLFRPLGSGPHEVAVARSGCGDVAQAFRAAERVLPDWQDLTAAERQALLLQIPELIDTQRMDCWLGDCLQRGSGCAVPSSRALNSFRQDCLRLLDGALTELALVPASEVPAPPAQRPTGIAVPLPLRTATDLKRLFPGLIEGATAVVAPLYACGRCSGAFDAAKLCALAGCLPAGVINLVMGLGLEVGVPLLSRAGAHEDSNRALPTRRSAYSQLASKAGLAPGPRSRFRNLCAYEPVERGPGNPP